MNCFETNRSDEIYVMKRLHVECCSQKGTEVVAANNFFVSLHDSTAGASILEKEAPNRVCCNALLAAYAHAAPVQWRRALALLTVMLRCSALAVLYGCDAKWTAAFSVFYSLTSSVATLLLGSVGYVEFTILDCLVVCCDFSAVL
jgi:hypothetical protein